MDQTPDHLRAPARGLYEALQKSKEKLDELLASEDVMIDSEAGDEIQELLDDVIEPALFEAGCTCQRGEGRHHPDCPCWDSHVDNYEESK